ncbi:MAG: hypothetical protein J3K34DRAFT_112687 [Monoraphidium minutum]|nr:MAG: hypothetical protein J3K34DRAFT_112687 [Monoraphidium minutum]
MHPARRSRCGALAPRPRALFALPRVSQGGRRAGAGACSRPHPRAAGARGRRRERAFCLSKGLGLLSFARPQTQGRMPHARRRRGPPFPICCLTGATRWRTHGHSGARQARRTLVHPSHSARPSGGPSPALNRDPPPRPFHRPARPGPPMPPVEAPRNLI